MAKAPEAELEHLREACRVRGIDVAAPDLLGLGDSATFAVDPNLVAKVTRWPGQREAAHRDVEVSKWLSTVGLPAVRAAGHAVDLPGGYAVTFWERLPETRAAQPAEIATYLRRLHSTPAPTDFRAPEVQPFVRISDRIDSADIGDSDRRFLHGRLAHLRDQWSALAPAESVVLHGDPHGDNVRATADGEVLVLDLERFAVGPAAWDLTLMASEYDSFGWLTPEQYREFAATYGRDILSEPEYGVFRDIRELRMTSWLANKAGADDRLRSEVAMRIRCLQGCEGPRPWSWDPV